MQEKQAALNKELNCVMADLRQRNTFPIFLEFQ